MDTQPYRMSIIEDFKTMKLDIKGGEFKIMDFKIPESLTRMKNLEAFISTGRPIENNTGLEKYSSTNPEVSSPTHLKRVNLIEITLNEGLDGLLPNYFEHCINLTKIQLPNSLTNIGESSFRGCVKLIEVVLPSRLSTIAASSFSNCEDLTRVIFPTRLEKIEQYAFYRCVSLTKINLPGCLKSVGKGAFEGCRTLCKAMLSSSTEVDPDAFLDCCDLLKIRFHPCLDILMFTKANYIVDVESVGESIIPSDDS